MYDETDIKRNRRQFWFECARLAIGLLPGLALMIAGFALRKLWMALLGALVCGCALIFLIDMKLMPVIRYGCFLRDVLSGLRRTTVGALMRIDDQLTYEDGIWVRRAILNVYENLDETGDRLFFLDGAKAIPNRMIGQDVALTSCDRFIVGIRPIKPEENDDE